MFQKTAILLLILSDLLLLTCGNITSLIELDDDVKKNYFLAEFVRLHYKTNGWNTLTINGELSNEFYVRFTYLGPLVTFQPTDDDDIDIEDIVPHHSNSIVITCNNLEGFDRSFGETLTSPYWHAHANVIIYCKFEIDPESIALIFFALWYHKVCNSVVIYYEQTSSAFKIFNFSPYVTDSRLFDYTKGCYTIKKIGMPMQGLSHDMKCEETCDNVTITSMLRAKHLGTCIGLHSHSVSTDDVDDLLKLNLFEDKAKNLHGYRLRAFVNEVLPFFRIDKSENGTYTLHSREGNIWNTMMDKMNFTIDVSPSKDVIKQKFDFELTIQQLFSFSHRKSDLFLNPIYLIDLLIIKVDLTFPFKESGVCFLSQRADFETILFDLKIIEENYIIVIQFVTCVFGVWFTFFIFNGMETGTASLDQLGKDFVNTIRNILNISVDHPPRRSSFRIFLGISIWCFFIINFSMQAAITSFFTAFKRGKEVETFEDIIEKGYNIEGMASPDVVLPDTEERFNKINAKLQPVNNLFECIYRMSNDSRRFCLIDCAVGRYLERNRLNDKGEQFLHIASDRVHSHYLTIIFHKYSPLTDVYNKLIMSLVEGGIVKKWEEYKYNDIKEEVVVKPLSMEDMIGVFKCYLLLIGLSSIIFGIEIFLYVFNALSIKCHMKWKQCVRNFRKYKTTKMYNMMKEKEKIKYLDTSTQTVP